MIFDDSRVLKIINEAPTAHIVRIFFYLAFHQPQEGIFGYKIPKPQIAGDLHIGRTVLFESLHWLKNNMYIQELKIDDESDFMVNPRFVMNNSDFQERMDEWMRRCRLDIQREIRLKRNRRLRRQKKDNQQ